MKYSFQNVKNGNLDYCQITGQENLKALIDLGIQPLRILLEKKDLKIPKKKVSLKILRSPILGHSQLSYIVPQEELYHLDYLIDPE